MSEHRLTIRLWEPVQAFQQMQQAWKWAKAMLVAGHRLVLEVKPEKRSNEQNAKLWATLSDISGQVEWCGQKLSAEDWKHIFSASLKKQRAVPGLDGGFVVLGLSTSRMSKAEFSELLELATAFGAERDVQWSGGEA